MEGLEKSGAQEKAKRDDGARPSKDDETETGEVVGRGKARGCKRSGRLGRATTAARASSLTFGEDPLSYLRLKGQTEEERGQFD